MHEKPPFVKARLHVLTKSKQHYLTILSRACIAIVNNGIIIYVYWQSLISQRWECLLFTTQDDWQNWQKLMPSKNALLYNTSIRGIHPECPWLDYICTVIYFMKFTCASTSYVFVVNLHKFDYYVLSLHDTVY